MNDLMTMHDIRERYRSGDRPASRSFVYAAEANGSLPKSIHIGGKKFWRRADVLARESELATQVQAVGEVA